MNHKRKKRAFGRTRNQKKALLKSLARELLIRGKITTTEAKAKELRPFAEKLISRIKKGTLASRRNVISKIGYLSGKHYDSLNKKFENRAGGYTRIVKLKRRLKDAAKIACIEFV